NAGEGVQVIVDDGLAGQGNDFAKRGERVTDLAVRQVGAMILALLVQLLKRWSIAQLHAIDRLEVGSGHLTAERLEGLRVRFVRLPQGLVCDVRKDGREVRG